MGDVGCAVVVVVVQGVRVFVKAVVVPTDSRYAVEPRGGVTLTDFSGEHPASHP